MTVVSLTPSYEGFVVAVTDGKPSRVDATRIEDALVPLARAEIAWLNFEVDDLSRDAPHIAGLLGFSHSLVDSLVRREHGEYDDRDTELGLVTPIIRVEDLEVRSQPLLVLVRGHFVLTLYQRGRVMRFRKFGRYAEVALRKIPRELRVADKLTILITRLLDENNDRNFEGLRAIEDLGEKIAAELVDESVDRRAMGPRIHLMKRALITYLDALWSSLDVSQNLRHGDAELITDDPQLLGRVALLSDDVQRHIQLSEHMSEVLSSGLEVMQGIHNNQLQALNNRMSFVITWLTVLGTAVLVPNTLATVMSAAPPSLHLTDPTAYLALMIGSTVVSTAAAWLWVRRALPATP